MRQLHDDALREELRQLVRAAAEPAEPGELVKSAIRRAARVLGLEQGRVKRYWYGEIQVPRAHEVDVIRAKIQERAAKRAPAIIPASAEAPIRHQAFAHFVYDDSGGVWSARSPELQEAMGVSVPDFDMAEFAVRNFGWVEVKIEAGQMRVKLAPRAVQSGALTALYDLLTTAPLREVVLIVRSADTWAREIRRSGTDAAERIGELIRQSDLGGPKRFLAARQPLSVLFRDKQSTLLDMILRIRHLNADESPEACIQLAEADPTGFTSVSIGAEGTSGQRSWTLRHIGRSIRFYSPEDRARLIGTDVRNTPDRDYGEWCALGYERAAASSDPLIEDVRAVVWRRGGPAIETSYRRLMVSLRGTNGQHIVLVTSELTRH